MRTQVEIVVSCVIESKNQSDLDEKRDALLLDLENVVNASNYEVDEVTLESEYEV